MAGELEALGLATAQGGHGLAEFDVFEAHIDDGLQHANHVAVVGKQVGGFAHREVEHIGHVEQAATTVDVDFQNLGAVTLAVAVLAAQIHVAEELHFDMLEARAAAGGAAAVATVEAEFGGGVSTLLREWRGGKQVANGVPPAHVADGVGAGGFADGGLVDKHHAAELVSASEAGEGARGLGGLAKVAQQCGRQNVLNKGGFARAADAGDGDQALQRKVHIDALQVVVARAFEHQTGGSVVDHALETKAHLLAAAEVGTREGVGLAQLSGRAVKHNLTAALTRARAHVDDAVGGEHDGGVVLHHHQRVARVTQAQHGLVDAGHVAWVQADAGFVEHKQGVDQRCAQGGGEVDALHLAAAQGAGLAVEGEVADADVAEVAQAGGDFVEQQA